MCLQSFFVCFHPVSPSKLNDKILGRQTTRISIRSMWFTRQQHPEIRIIQGIHDLNGLRPCELEIRDSKFLVFNNGCYFVTYPRNFHFITVHPPCSPLVRLDAQLTRLSLPQSFSMPKSSDPEVYHDFGDCHYQQYTFKHIHISTFGRNSGEDTEEIYGVVEHS